MSKQIIITANCTRDEEGYSDTQMGISLDIECDLSDVGLFMIEMRKLDKEFKDIYPQYEQSNIDDIYTHFSEGTGCRIFYRLDFSNISSTHPSTLHNISSLMSIYSAIKIANKFRELGYAIFDDSRVSEFSLKNTVEASNNQLAKKIATDQFHSFLWFVSDNLYEINRIEFNNTNEKDFLLQFSDKDFNQLAMITLSKTVGTEFGFSDPMDQLIPFSDYNPFNISEKSLKIITLLCKNIKYEDMYKFYQSDIV